MLKLYFTEAAVRKESGIWENIEDFFDGIATEVEDSFNDVLSAVEDSLNELIEAVNIFNKCDAWYEAELQNLPDFDEVIPSPCTAMQAARDRGNFEVDDACGNGGYLCDFFHNRAHICYRSRSPRYVS